MTKMLGDLLKIDLEGYAQSLPTASMYAQTGADDERNNKTDICNGP